MLDPNAPPAQTAARAVLGALFRKLLAIAGTALVTRGYVDQQSYDGLVPLIAEQIAGYALVAGATGWSVARAKLTHTRWAEAWNKLWAAPVPPSREP